jgi:CBS domain-containing protein
MKAEDVMTKGVISVTPDTPVIRAVHLMLQYDLSGFPVLDAGGRLVGIVTEADFLRRAETGTEWHRESWLELMMGASRLAEEYIRAHARRVELVMTREVATVSEDAPLGDVVGLMEARGINRVPVMRGDSVVGIVSRRDLLHALIVYSQQAAGVADDDAAIRARIENEPERQAWVPLGSVVITVTDGVVELCGSFIDEQQRQGLRVLVENVAGISAIRDKLVACSTGTGAAPAR